MELCSRWFTASPETSTEKIKKVILAKGKRAAHTETENSKFATWQKAFKILSEEAPFKTVIPYAATLSECFRAKKPIDMRFFDLFLALIKASTILHAHQREKNQQGALIATMQDYENSYLVFHEIERATTLGLGQNVIDFFQKIITPLWNEQNIISSGTEPSLKYEDLIAKHFEIYEEPISRGTLRENYLHPLENKGLIDIEENSEDRRQKLITVKDTLPETSLIDNEKFKKNGYWRACVIRDSSKLYQAALLFYSSIMDLERALEDSFNAFCVKTSSGFSPHEWMISIRLSILSALVLGCMLRPDAE